MRYLRVTGGVGALAVAFVLGWVLSGSAQPRGGGQQPIRVKGWTKGKGWGWVWGKDDEVGSLNAMTPDSILAALQLVKTGKVYDLGVPYNRNSFRWPGHLNDSRSYGTPRSYTLP